MVNSWLAVSAFIDVMCIQPNMETLVEYHPSVQRIQLEDEAKNG